MVKKLLNAIKNALPKKKVPEPVPVEMSTNWILATGLALGVMLMAMVLIWLVERRPPKKNDEEVDVEAASREVKSSTTTAETLPAQSIKVSAPVPVPEAVSSGTPPAQPKASVLPSAPVHNETIQPALITPVEPEPPSRPAPSAPPPEPESAPEQAVSREAPVAAVKPVVPAADTPVEAVISTKEEKIEKKPAISKSLKMEAAPVAAVTAAAETTMTTAEKKAEKAKATADKKAEKAKAASDKKEASMRVAAEKVAAAAKAKAEADKAAAAEKVAAAKAKAEAEKEAAAQKKAAAEKAAAENAAFAKAEAEKKAAEAKVEAEKQAAAAKVEAEKQATAAKVESENKAKKEAEAVKAETEKKAVETAADVAAGVTSIAERTTETSNDGGKESLVEHKSEISEKTSGARGTMMMERWSQAHITVAEDVSDSTEKKSEKNPAVENKKASSEKITAAEASARSAGFVTVSEAGSIGKRESMEDMFGVLASSPTFAAGAICDGSAGVRAAQITLQELKETYSRTQSTDAKILRDAMARAEQLTMSKAKQGKWHDASTAVVAAMDSKTIRIASVGDSLALIVQRDYSFTVLTLPHLATNPQEKARIKALGGKIGRSQAEAQAGSTKKLMNKIAGPAATFKTNQNNPKRVYPGGTTFTRCIGGLPLKYAPLKLVVADPDMIEYKRKENDLCLILASDGLFEQINVDKMTQMIKMIKDPATIAPALVKASESAGTKDNISAVVFWFG
eukprot:CAMPEP_0197323396 /NCGR_PEP_ID=MMETSP0891-20130614/70495_1 /TAXON_ID=44058 ORGANISM="Aureoumbra lagunensis, Strain CCMP1510" /NCGR_SAMPLE_ID=MMETSP0891 /ASSEMBLY_ACC=CAM_ASM_000534 /LENGTH=738 /DNA_ID=CAMNT_0042816033 /DNA_START=77 /DNA_END=2293 /DNA_ORIENTATION=-